MQNRCQKKWCKKYEKWCQNGAKMGAKIRPKSENIGKKRYQKIDAKIWCKKAPEGRIFRGFLRILAEFLGRGGGEGGVTNVIKDSLVNNLTRATPEGCGGSKMGAKIRPKIENVGKKGVKKLMRKIDARKMLDAKDFRGLCGFWIRFLRRGAFVTFFACG